jgi:hypothetical protein
VRESDRWSVLAAGSTNASIFDNFLNIDWWRKLANIIQLLKPVSDTIHQLEADKPRLSQVLTVWDTLVSHSAAWAEGKGGRGDSVVAVFKERYQKHYLPAMAAAQFVDPINFVGEGGAHPRPDAAALSEEQQRDVLAVVLRLNGKAASDAAAKRAVEAELTDLEIGRWPYRMQRYDPKLSLREEVEEGGEITLAPLVQRLSFWSSCAVAKFPMFAKAAVRLLSVHVTSAAAERNWSAWGRIYSNNRNRLGLETARKMVFINFSDDSELGGERDHEVALEY